MQFLPDCYSCLTQQALGASRHAGAPAEQQLEVMRQVLAVLQAADLRLAPAQIAGQTNRIVREVTGVADPYLRIKETSTRLALEMYPRLRELVAQSPDPFETALRLSLAGNIIDVVHSDHHDLEGTVQRALTQPLAGNGLEALRAAVARADHVLYLGDNAGETVFDRLLIEQIAPPVTYVVKGGPILNDATLAEAQAAGLDQVATLVSTGSQTPGTVLAECTPSFQQLFASATLIIAKGQSNCETLDHLDPRVFFLLQVKCPVLGQKLGWPQGSLLVKPGGPVRADRAG